MTNSSRFVRHLLTAAALALAALPFLAARADARDDLCDSSAVDCSIPLLNLIKAENVEIDVGMWFMEDSRYATELIKRRNAGVKVRIIFDNRSDEVGHPVNQQIVDQLAGGGIPMRLRVAPKSIEHWKVMIFDGQDTVYFGSANFSVDAFVPVQPYVNYVDETVYFTDNPSVVNSFRTKFDDAWVDASNYTNYANVPLPLARSYDVFPIDAELNFPPGSGQDFVARTMQQIDAEKTKIDVMMYRIVDDRALNSMIAAQQRGVPIRLLVDPQQYRDVTRQGVSFYLDKMYMAGIPMKFTVHQGLNHGKLTLLYGQTLSIFGSANWTVPSANEQHEENYFTHNPALFNWFVDFFDRRWNNTSPAGVAETGPFTPLPPDKPAYQSPANAATGVTTSSVALKWIGGPWAQYYDIYFGTSSNPPLLARDRFLGPSIYDGNQVQSFVLPTLKPGTTYYWKIVSKTAALQTRPGNVWSFTTSGTSTALPAGANTVVLWAANVPSSDVHGDWSRISDVTAAGGAALQNPDRSRAKIAPALASPANYFEARFSAVAGVPYRVWIRMRAQSDSLSNDSVHVQFSDSSTASGASWARIGTTSSLEMVLQDGPGGGPPHAWGWTDNGWQAPGVPVYFAASGSHVVRIQQREDGAIVDQIVLSPDRYFLYPPGWRVDDTTVLQPNSGSAPPPDEPPPSSAGTTVLWPGTTPAAQIHGAWQTGSDSGAAGGVSIWNPNAGAAKIAPALASPANYFELTFPADAGKPYHVWIRMRAQSNSLSNDSVHMQFSDTLTINDQPYARIGTTSSAEFVLQDGSRATSVHGWGWTDNGWDDLGPHVYFATTGTHKLRVQQREDGAIIDQIVISPTAYLTSPPGGRYDDTTVLQTTTAGTPPPSPSSSTIVLWPITGSVSPIAGMWKIGTDSGAGGSSIWNPDAGAAKVAPALANPANYFEMTFAADANTPYHVWIRMRAQGNSIANDSVHMQFGDAVDELGAAYAQIGTPGSAEFVLQAGPEGGALDSWGWTDNGWSSLGSHVRFAQSGTHRLRIQQREDGAIVDQIVLSPDVYLMTAPGARKNDTTILPRAGG